MAFPLPRGITPPEIAFLAEMEMVTILPRQRLEGLELLGVSRRTGCFAALRRRNCYLPRYVACAGRSMSRHCATWTQYNTQTREHNQLGKHGSIHELTYAPSNRVKSNRSYLPVAPPCRCG
jgi:hypothetical protein